MSCARLTASAGGLAEAVEALRACLHVRVAFLLFLIAVEALVGDLGRVALLEEAALQIRPLVASAVTFTFML